MKLKPAPIFPKFKKASEALQAAKGLISNKNRWIQRYMAVKANGDDIDLPLHVCGTKSKHAVAFCALGAVQRVNGPLQRSATAFLREAGYMLSYGVQPVGNPDDASIFRVNDEMGHDSTMKMFDLAIASAKKAEKREKLQKSS